MDSESDASLPRRVVRASDVDREAAAEQVRTAASDGRLDLDELDERLTAVYEAKTRGELAVVTDDLELSGVASHPLTMQTKSGILRRIGPWTAPAEIVAEVDSGSIKIDFTQARMPHREVVVRATAKAGRIVLVVPYGWAVVMDEVTSGAGMVPNKVGGDPATSHQVVRVIGTVGAGVIKARYPRRSFIDWLMRRPHAVRR